MWLVILRMLLTSPHKLFSTNTQVSRLTKAFENDSSANIKFSKTYLSKMVWSGWTAPF